MGAHISGRGSATGFIDRLAQSIRKMLAWRPGRYESAEGFASQEGGPVVPAQAEPEHVHHARYSPEELDDAIEHSFETGEADLYAAALKDSWSGDFDAARLRLKARKAKPKGPEKRAGDNKAFGGDLYPTSAHATGQDVRYVKVSTWASKAPKPESAGAPPA